MRVFMVTEHIDIETQAPHGVFSSPELATAYVMQEASGGAQPHAGERAFTAKRSGHLWVIDEYTVDALVKK